MEAEYEEKPAERTMSFDEWCKIPPCLTEIMFCTPRDLIFSCRKCREEHLQGIANKHLHYSYEDGLKGVVTRIYKEFSNA